MSNSNIKQILQKDILKIFKDNKMPDAMIDNLQEKIAELGSFIPTVGIFGKTGVGKSSLCNALFGKDTAKVDDVQACTRAPQEIFIQISEAGSGIKLIDLPGVGESQLRDTEYSELYKQWIPKLDLIIWVIRGDDRTFSVDEHFYETVIKRHIDTSKTPFLVVINQVDKINPIRDWNTTENTPGLAQMKTIGERIHWAASKFAIPSNHIVCVSAYEKYNLAALVEIIIDVVPNEKKLGFLGQIEDEVITEKTKESAAKGVIEHLKNFYKEIKPYIPAIIEAVKWLVKLWKK